MMSHLSGANLQPNLGNTHFCLKEPENCSPAMTLRGKETRMHFFYKKEEDNRCFARKIDPKSTSKTGLFQHDIFQNQKVPVGDIRRYSRHLAAEIRGPAKLPVHPKEDVKSTVEMIGTIELLHKADFGKVEIAEGKQEMPKSEKVIRRDEHRDICSTLQQEEQTEKEPDEFDNIAVIREEVVEERNETKKDKSVFRRFRTWLHELHDKK
ncbi:ATP-dependent helicase/deoxyribonuclease subunit B [Dissostichus eleginoides]|uniref:ATP-dependent helicase/deoxyribonuclease subunit B n=1 Tax=Dissostichus eleginoides TaxID=100907 RepID=A0AAD9BVK8_DISEL|nr:ATP-dependent helicase/deoxyribonuclease subunit B [Dissostichus eleginoides]